MSVPAHGMFREPFAYAQRLDDGNLDNKAVCEEHESNQQLMVGPTRKEWGVDSAVDLIPETTGDATHWQTKFLPHGASGSFRFWQFLCKTDSSVFQSSLTGKDGSGFGSWKTVLAVPVPAFSFRKNGSDGSGFWFRFGS